MRKINFILTIALLGTLLVFSCKKTSTTNNTTTTKTLYERLGGISAISAVTDQFLTNVATDTAINADFAATVANPYRLKLLRNNLIDQICAGSGGPCQYKGLSMADAHKGMGVTDADFDALVGDLIKSLDKFSVPAAEKAELLGILGPMRTDIVGK